VKLSPKERAFARAYVKLREGKAAAIEAGYSAKTAESKASQLLRKVKVKAEVDRLEGKIERVELMKAEEVEKELDRIIRFNLKEFVDVKTGEAKPLHELTSEQAACIKEFSTIETQIGTSRNLKFYDKLGAIRTKMQRLNMLVEKHEVEHSGNVTVEVIDYTNAVPKKEGN